MRTIGWAAAMGLLTAGCGGQDAGTLVPPADSSIAVDAGDGAPARSPQWATAYRSMFTASTGDKPILSVPNMLGGGHALTWDGRLAILSDTVVPTIAKITDQTPVATIQPAAGSSQVFADGYAPTPSFTFHVVKSSTNLGNPAAPYYACSASLTDKAGDVLWTTPNSPCSKTPQLAFDGATFYFSDADLANKTAKLLWTSGTTSVGSMLAFYDASPYMAVVAADGTPKWDVLEGPTTGWYVRLLSAEKLGSQPSMDLGTVATHLNDSFTDPVIWGLPETVAAGHEADFAAVGAMKPQILLGLPTINSITIAPNQVEGRRNPFPARCSGDAAGTTSCMQYDMTVYTTSQPLGLAAPAHLMVMSVQAVVRGSHGFPEKFKGDDPTASTPLALDSITASRVPEAAATNEAPEPIAVPLVAANVPTGDTNNPSMLVAGIEPTVTFDGRLIVYQRFGALAEGSVYAGGLLFYSYNDAPNATLPKGLAHRVTGWSAPRPITGLSLDALDTRAGLGSRGYPLARYPMRDGLGSAFASSASVTPAVLPGAYPWVSPEGADLFFEAAISADGNRRAGTSLVGGSTKGMVRLVDGGPNVSRSGQKEDATTGKYGGPLRLFMSSLGLTPGMWSPLELQPYAPLPLTDKRHTYPMFASNSAKYFEVSCEETVAGNYDAYYDMTEAMSTPALATSTLLDRAYDVGAVQDISGNFRVGTKSGGAYFPDDVPAFACTDISCAANDPTSGTANLFSGKAVYFDATGAIVAASTAASPSPLLADANSLTVSFAVLPLVQPQQGQSISLVSMKDTFDVVLDHAGSVTATVYTSPTSTSNAVPIKTAITSSPIPIDATQPVWTSIAVTYDSVRGALDIYANGRSVATTVKGTAGFVIHVDSPGVSLVIGPNATGTATVAGPLELALDQVGISRVVRTGPELMRQAAQVFERVVPAKAAVLAPGIQPKDVRSDLLLAGLSPTDVEHGADLFFDTLLSPDSRTACASCHVPGYAFTDQLQLHANRVVEFGQAPHVLRNTPGLLYVGLREQFFLDGRAPDLLTQAADVLGDGMEINDSFGNALGRVQASPRYRQAFGCGSPPAPNCPSGAAVQDALQAFELSLLSLTNAADTPFDRYESHVAGATLTDDELAGRALFFGKARCAQCHSGSGFTDGGFHALPFLATSNLDVQPDPGRMSATGGRDDFEKFATPSLRNLNFTGPYLHDGSAPTLDAVIANYMNVGKPGTAKNSAEQDVMLLPIDLEPGEPKQLKAFLLSLSGTGTQKGTVQLFSIAPFAQNPLPAGYTQPAADPTTQTYPFTDQNNNSVTMITTTTDPSAYAVGDMEPILQTDGNFVIYDGNGKAVWQTGSASADKCAAKTAPCQLSLSLMNGELQLTNTKDHAVLWSTCIGPTATPATQFVLSATEPYVRVLDAQNDILWASSSRYVSMSLGVGAFVSTASASRHIATPTSVETSCPAATPWYFAMQKDGNLGLCSTSPIAGVCGGVLEWSTYDHAVSGDAFTATFQPGDGNLVVRDATKSTIPFASNTPNARSKQFLVLRQSARPYVYIEDWMGNVTYPAPTP